MSEYEHIVYVIEKDGANYVAVDRLWANRRRDFCTHIELSEISSEQEGWELMDKVADWLGHTLLIDNPDFRRHIGIESEEE